MYKTVWGKLPVEMISTIFEQLDRKEDLLQCQLTCKSWSLHAQRALYRNIHLYCGDSEKIEKLIEVLNKPSANQQLGRFIKHFSLHPSLIFSSVNEVKQALYELSESLRKNCPQIRTIYLDLGLFLLFTLEDSFWESWAHNTWQSSLERITVCDNNIANVSATYADLSLFYKNTLKTLELCNKESLIDITAEESGNDVFDLLKKELAGSSFSSLEHLKIDVSSDNNIFQFDPFISQNLKSLEMKIVSEKRDIVRMNSRQKGIEILDRNISDIGQCFSLRQLNLRATFNSNDSFRYLIHKFPGLKRLIVNKADQNIELEHTLSLWKQSGIFLPKDTMKMLIEYLVKIQQFEIDHIYLDNHVDLIDALIKESNRKKKSFYYLSLDCQTPDDDLTDFKFDPNYSPQQRINVCKNTASIEKNMSNDADFYSIDIAIGNSNPLASRERLLQSVGRNLVGLKISETLENNRERKKTDLGTIFTQHKNLRELEIEYSEPFLQSGNSDLAEKEKNESIEKLILSSCNIDLKTIPEALKRLPNLKALSLLGQNMFLGSKSRIVYNVDLSDLVARAATSSLKTLELSSLLQFLHYFHNNNDTEKRSHCCTTIETLVLTDCIINVDIFPEVANRFPNLKTLRILGEWNKLVDSFGRKVKGIDMSHLVVSFPHITAFQIDKSIPVLQNV